MDFKLKSAESAIQFIQKEHERVLHGLHMEIERLQQKCSGKAPLLPKSKCNFQLNQEMRYRVATFWRKSCFQCISNITTLSLISNLHCSTLHYVHTEIIFMASQQPKKILRYFYQYKMEWTKTSAARVRRCIFWVVLPAAIENCTQRDLISVHFHIWSSSWQ